MKTKVNASSLRKKLLPLVQEAYSKKNLIYSGDPGPDRLIHSNSFAFLLGVISDQMMISERVWQLPFLLKQRLGHLEPSRIVLLKEKEFERIIRKPSSLHRFPRTMARWFIKAAELVVKKYDGKTENIWKNVDSAVEVQRRFREFSGISQKKSSMMTKMLIRDWKFRPNDLATVNLPFDIHVRRVLLRTGLTDEDSVAAIEIAGQNLNSEYPAQFDDAIWLIGRRFCYQQNPDHENCPLNKICPKLSITVISD